jgi:hypothetical protein
MADEDFFRDTPIDAEGEHTESEIITSVCLIQLLRRCDGLTFDSQIEEIDV